MKKVFAIRVAVIGSRSLFVNGLELYLHSQTKQIVSGGARGIDLCAKRYAEEHHIPYLEILPDYARYGKKAPLIRNLDIIAAADLVLAFWDGHSHGTAHVIRQCKQRNIPICVYCPNKKESST